MGFILYIIVVGISLMMFVVRREQKLALLIFYSMCLSSVRLDAYMYSSILTPSVCFLLSEITRLRNYYIQLKHTPFYYLFAMLVVATFVVYVTSPHLQGVKGMFIIFKTDFVLKYFSVLYALFSLGSFKGFKIAINTVYISILILTVFGILNQITHHAIFVDWALEGTATVNMNDAIEDAGARFTDSIRFRVQAMHQSPFVYGYICMFSSVLFVYAWRKCLLNRVKFLMAFGCCIFGIVVCGSRTVLLCSLICYVIYYLLVYGLSKNMQYVTIFLCLFYMCYLYIPVIHDKLQFIGSIFNDNSSVEGSSIEMRTMQFAAVLYHIKNHLLFGRGYEFFNIDLGWKDGKEGLLDKDLMGLEGIQFNLLLERGVMGLLVYAVFWLSMLCILYKYRKTDKQTCALCISVTIGYLMFSIMTGELGSLFYMGLILGMGMKMYYLTNRLS